MPTAQRRRLPVYILKFPDLTGSWNDADNSLSLSWTLPVSYPAGTTLQLKTEPSTDGQCKNVFIKIRDLPPDTNTVTLDSQ